MATENEVSGDERDPKEIALLKPCMYCRLPKPKTDEHVLYAALGGTAVLEGEVCGDCNTRVFSPLDGHLINYIRGLAYIDHPDVSPTRSLLSKDMVHFRDENVNAWVSARLDARFGGRVFDQIVRREGKDFHVSLDPLAKGTPLARFDLMLKELATPESLELSDLIVPGMTPEIEPALVRSAPRKYVLRGASCDAVAKLRQEIESKYWAKAEQTGPATPSSTPSPEVKGLLKFHLAAMLRSLAKTALNFVALAYGAETARQSRFDEIRRFAIGDYDETAACPVRLLERGHVSDLSPVLCQPDHHSIAVAATPEGLAAQLMFYQRAFATVVLTKTVEQTDAWSVGLFDYKRRAFRLVNEQSMRDGMEPWTAVPLHRE